MPTEILLLGWSVILLLVQIVIQASLATSELGMSYNLSARDEVRRPTGALAGRAQRVLDNFLQTYPAFIALALGVAIAGKTGGFAVLGAHLYLWARVAFLPVYLAGIPVVRTLLWGVSIAGLLLMTFALLA